MHLDSLLRADKFRKSHHGESGSSSVMSLKDAFVEVMGPSIHPASLRRAREVEYVRNAAATVLPHLIPPRFHHSK